MKKNKTVKKKLLKKRTKFSVNEQVLKALHTHFKTLEDNLTGLQQEIQETLSYMEMRLENLELIVAEIQAELLRKPSDRGVNVRPHHH